MGREGIRTSENLRDQASRLEKDQEEFADASCLNDTTVVNIDESILSNGNSDTVLVEGNRSIGSEINSDPEREDANQAMPNLHTSTVQLPEEPTDAQPDQLKREKLTDGEVPGPLPECDTLHTPSSFVWGSRSFKMVKEDQ